MARILCALSGGVDSSTAASLLVQDGHEVIGVFMRNGVVESAASGKKQSCCSASDARDAARVADRLGIAFYAVDYAEEFASLIDEFRQENRLGRTPSPCIRCNQDLKFGHLLEFADAVGAEQIATGHYARIVDGQLHRPVDRSKDQTYFLFGIDRAALARSVFPLGARTKAEVRALAEAAGLPNARKPESMEICFVPSGDYRDLLRAEGALTPGRFVDRNGRDLGPHKGFEGFTIGQRRGLPALGAKHYVLEVRPTTGEVVLGERAELAALHCRVVNTRWLAEPPAAGAKLRASVQIRARHNAAEATLRVEPSGDVVVSFASPQDAVAPGQAAVFYEGERVLGGGWIRQPSLAV